MNAAERNALCKYVYELQKRLRLADWNIYFVDEPSEPSEFAQAKSAASMSTVYGRKVAHLRVGPDWNTFSPEVKRHTLTHELIHLHWDEADNVIFFTVRKQLAPAAWEVVEGEFNRQMERAVDGLADVLAPLMPMPPEPNQKKTRRQES